MNSTHVANCKKIDSKLITATKYLSSGKLNKAHDSVIEVEKIAETQPDPVRIAPVLKDFDRIASIESGLFDAKTKMTKEVNKIESAQAQTQVTASKKCERPVRPKKPKMWAPIEPQKVDPPGAPPQEPMSPVSPKDRQEYAEKMTEFLQRRDAYEEYLKEKREYDMDRLVYDTLLALYGDKMKQYDAEFREWVNCEHQKRIRKEQERIRR
ncbi:MAG: hypothetical protein D3920_16095 [Candidatus Electrothrix sp. AW2]|nr:hypothetical protein [Candidatus Electrothrix gigas]